MRRLEIRQRQDRRHGACREREFSSFVGQLQLRPALLRREPVSLALLPSIVHETFSYVTAELMHFGVPLAVFDIGAPAERVRDYPRGRIISRIDARIALAELLAFHAALRASHAPGAIPMDGT